MSRRGLQQTAGYFLGYVGYMGLESYGLVTLSGFLFFWSLVFVGATTLVALLKSEKEDVDEEDLGIVETYKTLYKICRLPLMAPFVAFLLTAKVGFSAADSVTSLKVHL